jgi:hypothetical protein
MDFFKSVFEALAAEAQSQIAQAMTQPPQGVVQVPVNTGKLTATQARNAAAANDQPTEESKAKPKPQAAERNAQTCSKKLEDDRLTQETSSLLSTIGLINEFPRPSTFVERWVKLDDLLREHGVPTSDLQSALNLLVLYRGSESREERKAKVVAWSLELEKDDGLGGIYNTSTATARRFQPDIRYFPWEVVRVRDVIARNLKTRTRRDPASLKPGTIATSPLELMEFNSNLLASQANQLIEKHKDIDLTDISVQRMSFDDLRVYLDNLNKAPVKRSGWSLTEVLAKSVKAKENDAAPQSKPPIPLPAKEPAKSTRACKKLSADCLQLWVSRELPCKFCKKKIIEPCPQCNQDIAASSCLLLYECRHLVHKNCVAVSHIQLNRCPQCLKTFNTPPTQLN